MTKKKWKCPVCGYVNYEEDEICQSCGSLRAEPAYEIVTDLED